MRKVKALCMKLVTSAVFAVAVTTLASTSRCFAFQPKQDGELAEKYGKG